ncbi:hypothetical protein ACHOLT_14390 [Desulfitobacterium sp. Sab5]|uniref:hypothetical protein n=1 Tax=Desulfitobacterium nosdiversum TaxID=3375356 RepID=UPI003CF72530
MPKKVILKRHKGVVQRWKLKYTITEARGNGDVHGKEGQNMTEMTQKLNSIQIPPHVLKQLGLDKNWQNNISPEVMSTVIKTAEKYKSALRRLSRH